MDLGIGFGLRARSSCLWLQLFGVEGFSFLPDPQRDGGDLARQREPCHLRPHALGQQPEVDVAKHSLTGAGGGGGSFKQVLQLVVVVPVQAPHQRRLGMPPGPRQYGT